MEQALNPVVYGNAIYPGDPSITPRVGGNGNLTRPQRILSYVFDDFEAEGCILTYPVKHQFKQRLPGCYKVDLLDRKSKTAIEIDGKSHRRVKVEAKDKLKTAVLEALGWQVIRFTNEMCNEHMEFVALLIALITGWSPNAAINEEVR